MAPSLGSGERRQRMRAFIISFGVIGTKESFLGRKVGTRGWEAIGEIPFDIEFAVSA